MKKLMFILLLGVIGWQVYGQYQQNNPAPEWDFLQANKASTPAVEMAAPSSFKCDGRTHCSQMTSCAEATFFLKNCPNVKMDGNHDGVPCEKQWCN